MVSVSCSPKPLDVLNGLQQIWKRKGMSLEKSVQLRRINHVGAANKGENQVGASEQVKEFKNLYSYLILKLYNFFYRFGNLIVKK